MNFRKTCEKERIKSNVMMLNSFLVLVYFTSVVLSDTDTDITSELGTIHGKRLSPRIKGVEYSVRTFLGIPYAKPPLNEKRFKQTELLTSIPNPFNATKFGPACPQLPARFVAHDYKSQSEDCLYLNIYVPDRNSSDSRGFAVMVFVHGGRFMYDAAERYSGDVISALHEVIVVTINYRLGIFGFLSLGVQEGRGNLGFWDQHIAFKWVHRYIQGFGGDRNRITIFGVSAGGQSTVYQALFAQNSGLFQRFISESGNPPIIAQSKLSVNFKPMAQLNHISKILGCQRVSRNETITCLQSDSLNTSTVMDKLQAQTSIVLNQPLLRFNPTIDGEIIKTNPAHLRSMPNTKNIDDFKFYRSLDMMTGFNNREGGMFAELFLPNPDQFRPTLEEFYNIYIPVCLQAFSLSPSPTVIDIIRSEYTNWNATGTSVSAVQDQYLDLWLDLAYSIGTLSYAQLHADVSATGATYVYRFKVSPTNHVVPVPSWVQGANHVDELPFVFGFSKPMEKTLFNDSFKAPEEWERDLSEKMMTYWTNFAKSGDPNKPVAVSPAWPRYDKLEQEYIELEQTMNSRSAKQYLLSGKLDFWLRVYPALTRSLQNGNQRCAS